MNLNDHECIIVMISITFYINLIIKYLNCDFDGCLNTNLKFKFKFNSFKKKKKKLKFKVKNYLFIFNLKIRVKKSFDLKIYC